MFMLDCAVIVVLVYMGLRDDRRSARTPATSIFRTRDRAGDVPATGADRPAGAVPDRFQPLL
jgi:hypothetical protein